MIAISTEMNPASTEGSKRPLYIGKGKLSEERRGEIDGGIIAKTHSPSTHIERSVIARVKGLANDFLENLRRFNI
jgi:hypothetical protein